MPDFKKTTIRGEIKRKPISRDGCSCSYIGRIYDLPLYQMVDEKGITLFVPACYIPDRYMVEATTPFVGLDQLSTAYNLYLS